MKMQVVVGVLAVLCVCLVAPAGAAGAPVMHTDASGAANAMMQAFGKAKPGERYQIAFLDPQGKKLDFNAFMQKAQQGQRFVIDTNSQAYTATWKLLPAGVSIKGALFMKPPPAIVKTDTVFPSFDLPLVTGGALGSASLRGQPLLIDFFFADCVGCIEELPALNAYHAQHPEMRVLAVTFDDKSTAQTFVKKWHPAWPVAYAGQKLVDQAGISAYPTLMLIGADGRVLDTRIGNESAKGPSRKLTAQDIERWVSTRLPPATQSASSKKG